MATQEDVTQKCPKIQAINKDLYDLSYEERLKIIEEDANSLYAFCLKKSLSENEIKECVSGLYGSGRSISAKTLHDSKKSFIIVAVIVAIISMAYASPQVSSVVAAHHSLFLAKVVLPFWNYGELWNEECLVYNAWLPEKKEAFNSKTCKYCINIVKLNNNTIDRVNGISKADVQKHYLLHSQPIIIEDTLKEWNSEILTMSKISELYQTNPFLVASMGSCAYETNVGFNDTFYDFTSAYVDGVLPDKWHIRWENCDSKAAKVLRKYYSRPKSIPDMAQSSSSNSFIVAKGDQPERFVFGDQGDQGRWLTLVSGTIKGRLLPMEECMDDFGCKVAEFNMKTGESLFFFPQQWDFEYEITAKEETLIVSSSLIWDDFE